MSFINEKVQPEGLTFDDVLLVPAYSEVLPREVSVVTRFSRNIQLNIPIVSAAMDTVTEAPLAIALAREGGIGVIHKNMSIAEQAAHVRKVKRAENGMIYDPITISKDDTVGDALALMKENKIGGIPVVAPDQHLIGIVTNRDLRFQRDMNRKIDEVMTKEGLVTTHNSDLQRAADILLRNKIEKLPVVDADGKLVGLITYKDITKVQDHPNACKDAKGRLRVAAGVGITPDVMDRVKALVDEDVDAVVLDTLPELEKATGKPAKELEPLLYQMSCVGLLEYNWENPRREKQYILPVFVPGSAEFFNMNKQQIADHPEVTAFFERMTFLPLEHITAMVPPGGAGIGMHVIPVEKAIETENHSLDIEHISHWLKKYEDQLGVGYCSCRNAMRIQGEGCGELQDEMCIAVGQFCDYCLETGKGRKITYDEAMEILQRAEDNGYVHQITNIDGEDKIFAICNCALGSCFALRTSQLFNTPNMSASAYRAHVDAEKCVACGKCAGMISIPVSTMPVDRQS